MAQEKILLVEDHAAIRSVVGILLRSRGYLIFEAATAQEAFAVLKTERPDLILMDIQLPDMDGLEATRRLKQDAATQNIPVIAVTGNVMNGDREAAIAAGCVEYIAKPIDRTTFIREVATHLGRKGEDSDS